MVLIINYDIIKKLKFSTTFTALHVASFDLTLKLVKIFMI